MTYSEPQWTTAKNVLPGDLVGVRVFEVDGSERVYLPSKNQQVMDWRVVVDKDRIYNMTRLTFADGSAVRFGAATKFYIQSST